MAWNPRANELFLNALDIQAEPVRRAYLDASCGADQELRQAVEALLRANAAAGSFLENSDLTAATLGPAPAAEDTAEKAGTIIAGRYKLLEKIGEGGMGTVWMAEQSEPVRRLVALKVIKAGMDSGQVVARFEAERQALAMMDHPNIAKVLDAGTVEHEAHGRPSVGLSRPFFAMELVKGIPITRYCDERRLSPRERLELFLPVCLAVQHAHQKGIIHRDLKPSNILVALYDGKPVPKVIDFGVVKATGQQLTEKTLFTGFGALVGTLEYMSPEQAELNQLDVDTRSDIYSLGVVLYELLTGSTPLDRKRIKEKAILEVLLMIREEEPPRPSTRLSGSDTLATLSEQRQTEPAKLARLMRGDLDWIVMKALDKDRGRRYETASGLAQDIERYLRDEPVQAGPPSALYRWRKFVKRNKGPVLAASLLLVALVGGILGTTLGMLRAQEAEWQAEEARSVAEGNKLIAEALKDEAINNAEEAEKQERLAKQEKATADKLRQLAEEEERKANELRVRAEKGEGEARKLLKEAKETLFTAQIDRAAALWQHDPPQGLKILRNPETCPHKDRDFTWHFYQRLCDVERTIFRGVSGRRLTCAALSPDGKKLAAGCVDNTVLVWDFPAGNLVHHCKGHKEPVQAVAFSSDGKTLFSGSEDRHIQRWDIASGKPHATPFVMPGTVSGLAMQPGGKWLAAGSHVENKNDKSGWRLSKGTVTLWHVDTGEAKEIVKEMADGVITIACSPDGKWVAAGFGIDVCARVWDVDTGKEYGKFQGANAGWVQGLTFSNDGKHLALATADLRLHLFDFATKGVAKVYEGHQNELWGVAISPKNKVIATTGWDRTLRLWNMDDRWDHGPSRELMVFHGYAEAPVLFTPDGSIIVQKEGLGNLVQVVPPTQAEHLTLTDHANGIRALAFSGDGRYLASVSNDHSARLWDRGTGQTRYLGDFVVPPACVTFSPDSQIVLVGATVETPEKKRVHEIARWDVKSAKRLAPLLGHQAPVTALAVSARHGLLASGSSDGMVKLWDLAAGKPLDQWHDPKKPSPIHSLAFHPTEKLLATDAFDRIWDFTDNRLAATRLPGSPAPPMAGPDVTFASPAAAVSFSALGKYLVKRTANEVSFTYVQQGETPGGFNIQSSVDIQSSALSPDERTLALGLKDRTIQLWDVPSRQLRATLTGHVRSVTALAFSPDNKLLASGDQFLGQGFPWVRGGVIKLWNAEPRR